MASAGSFKLVPSAQIAEAGLARDARRGQFEVPETSNFMPRTVAEFLLDSSFDCRNSENERTA